MKLRVYKILQALFIVITTFIFFLLYLSTKPKRNNNSSYFPKEQFLTIAHRGGLGLKPENTMLAFENADSLGADVLEMDVHLSKDGKLVVIHDDTVDRTTNKTGYVANMNFDQLRKLDAAYNWKNKQGQFEYRNQQIRIPKLSEILARFGNKKLLIEIKPDSIEVAQKLCAELMRYDMQEKTMVGSFHSKPLNYFSDQCKTTPTSASSLQVGGFLFLHYLRIGNLYPNPPSAFQVPEHLGSFLLVDKRFIEQVQNLKSLVHIWTVNEPSKMQNLIELNVNGIITDYPNRLKNILNKRNKALKNE